DLALGDLALVHVQQAADRPQQRRLAGAVGTKHGDDLAFRHLEADAAQNQDDVVVDNLEVLYGKHARPFRQRRAEQPRIVGRRATSVWLISEKVPRPPMRSSVRGPRRRSLSQTSNPPPILELPL